MTLMEYAKTLDPDPAARWYDVQGREWVQDKSGGEDGYWYCCQACGILSDKTFRALVGVTIYRVATPKPGREESNEH